MKAAVLLMLLSSYGAQAVSPTPMLSNLNTAGEDIINVFSGTGYGVGFYTGSSIYTLNSVTIEEYAYSGSASYFHVQIYSLGPIGSVPPPGWPWLPYATLSDAGVDPRPWPAATTLVDHTPASPLTLSSGSVYMIGVIAGPGSPGTPALIFASSEAYSVAGDWHMYASSLNNQWFLDPNLNGWLNQAPNGFEGLKLEVNATAVPEPSMIGMILTGVLVGMAGRSRLLHRRVIATPKHTAARPAPTKDTSPLRT